MDECQKYAGLFLQNRSELSHPVSITKCRVCNSSGLERILSLGDQYVSDFVSPEQVAPKAPLDVARCTSCGLVQLLHTFPRSSLYRHYWYRSGISGMMRKALADLVSRACEIAQPKAGDMVVDIGCNDGTLLRSYSIEGLDLVGFEPAENLVAEARKGTTWIFNDFFSSSVFKAKFGSRKPKIVSSVAMFYDLDDPNRFVAEVAEILDQKGVFVVQQNYLATMLEQNGFDNIGHEHLEYYSLGTLQTLLKRHGLEVFDTEMNDVNGGSFRTLICHKGIFSAGRSVREMEEHEARMGLDSRETYNRFADRIEKIRSQVHGFVYDGVRNGKTFYVYGASNRGNTILQYFGLDYRLIKKATDANSEKWGKKTVGTMIPIVSKAEARQDRPDYFVILPHHFLAEIEHEEHEYMSSGGKLIVPLPKFRIISDSHISA